MTRATATISYRVVSFDQGYDFSGFDCGLEPYNHWLMAAAAGAVRAGTAAVYLLVGSSATGERVIG
ncbi:MAG: hypothetical protein LBK95_08540 [Bifidobacteriaceae bacterium]|jgi:hypothetical protein|nr:hypothetical protein [Bifidobacteriaceae bacterium]